jgi:hypothetical protein
MPVKAVGKNIVEVGSGKVVGHSANHKKAQSAANMRNMAHAVKQGHLSKEKFDAVKEKAGNTDYKVIPPKPASGPTDPIADTLAGFTQPVPESTLQEVAGTNISQVQVTPITTYKGSSQGF